MFFNRHREVDMLNGPILPRVLEFSIPLMLTGLLQLLYNAADIVVVGRFAGPQALAAVGSTSSLINLTVNCFLGVSVGASVTIARQYGARDYEAVHQTVHSAIALAIVCGLGVTLVGVFGCRQMLIWMDSPEDVLPLATEYLQIFFLGTIANLVYNFGAGILRAIGDTKRPLYFLIISGLVNVVLNLVLVIVFDLDVAGVAIATITSQILSAVMVILCLVRANGCFRLDLRRLHFYGDKVKAIFRVGLPAGLQSILFSISNVLIQSAVNGFGSVVVAGNAAASNIEGFIYTSMNAFYQTCMTFTSQNLGARKFDRIDAILRSCLLSVTVVGLATGLSAWFFGEPLLGIYTSDPEVIAKGLVRMAFICPLYFICGHMDVLVGHLRGMGSSVPPMLISLTGACGLRILWIRTFFAWTGDLRVLFLSYPVSWIITAAAEFVYSRYYKRRLLRANGIE